MNRENIETIYRLSPVQQGMLFHTLYAPGEGVYFEQFNMTFGEGFDPAAFERTWQELVDRNPVLRTAFAWEGLEEPVQIVHKRAKLPFEVLDWREVPESEKESRLRDLVGGERRRGFDLARPPLVRFAVVRLRDELWHVVWSYHHAILDGWSAGLLGQEVSSLYRTAIAGEPLRAQPRRPFRDYIAWLRQQEVPPLEAYWRRVLAGFTTPTPQGIDRPAHDRNGETGRDMKVALVPEARSEELKAWARSNRLTLSTLIQGAWALVLSRVSGEEDLVFGLTVSGRPPSLPGIEGMLGCFVNTLPVRVRVPAGEAVLPWLQELQAGQVELRKYEHSPLVQVLGWSEVPRPTPLFESIFVFEGFMETARDGAFQRTNYPLVLIAGPDQEIVLRVDYELERFEPAAIDRLLGHLQSALAAFVADPGQRLEDIEILTEGERRQLAAWNQTGAEYPLGSTLHELIAGQAERTPEAVAVTFEDESLTYAELRERAGCLARHLRRLGVEPEVRVGVCAERSLELVVGLLGTLEAGGAYVPLDPSYPADRLAWMVADSAVPVLLTQRRFVHSLPEHGARVILLDEPLAPAEETDGAPVEEAGPGHLAYVIYTSGSTGRPKGAMNVHRGIVNRLLWMQETYGLTPGDRVLQKTPFSFDVSVWELFWPLLVGARLVMARPGGHQDPAYLVETIVREGITTLHFVPSMLQAFVEQPGVERCASLKRVIASGEALPFDLQLRFFQRLGAELHNLYGPTEAAVDVTFWPCEREGDRRTVPIGRPVANTRIHLLDRGLRPVPAGVAGELWIGGVQVGRGYLNRPELTAERFAPDPFSAEPGARLYRTGDLARWGADGTIEYLGRLDHQVKLRGFRIELGESEAALSDLAGVREAAVLALEREGEKRLVAFVVFAAGAAPAVEEMRRALGERLPDYMVPAAFVPLDALPLSPNGKADRKALAARAADAWAATPRAPYAAPRTPLEEMVAGVWSEVLGAERVGRNDDFFDLGGHSLLAMKVVSRFRETLRADLPLRSIFEAPTVAAQALLLEAARTGGGPAAPPLRALPREGSLPLSFSQERLWFLDQLQPGTAVYNIPAGVRLSGRLDVAALRSGLREVARRHEALRTVFTIHEGRPVQVVHPDLFAPLPLVDLSALPAPERGSVLRRLAGEEARRPFDLGTGPLLRHVLVRASAEEHLLLLTLHHIVSDGWSMGVFVRETAALYAAFSQGRPSPLAELPLQYADFARWQREWLRGEVLAEQMAFWRERLAGAPALTQLPTDRPRPAVQRYRGGNRPMLLPSALTRALHALGRRQGATLFMTLLAGLDALLVRSTGQEDLVVGTPVAGRTRVKTEGLIGFFLNTLALRTDVSGRPGFAALLSRVREATLGAFAHQDLPFEKLVEELAPERSLSHAPFFQVQLVLQNMGIEPLEIPGLRLSPVGMDSGTAKFDLTLNASETAEGVAGFWFFNLDLLDGTTVERFSGHLRALLEGAAAEPERPFQEIPLLGEAELQQLREWNATGVPYGGAGLLHERIEEQVDRTPDAPAVVFGGASLTYRELDARANGLARRLIAAGAGPDTLVGVCAERSLELVVALLAVLKAGGAYVPFDPSYPADRLAFMLADSGVPVLFAQPALLDRLPPCGARVLPLEEGGGGEAGRPAVSVDPDGLAYMIYTSGSTGRPKGAMNSHRGIVNRLLWMQETFGLDATDRVLQKTPFSFDVSVWEFFWPLMTGACLVVAKPGGHQDPAYLAGEIARQGITTLHFVPSMLQVFLGAPGLDRRSPLRRVLCSGEALPAELQRRFFELLDVPLHNLYGPTEAAVDVSWWPCEREDTRAGVPIGRPVANTELHVLDREGRPAPVGVPGELLIGGVQVGRGYHGRPDLTAERFVPDPFGRPGARMYRTGDLARFLSGGAIEFLGRLDHQVKIRGFRIELGEIEAALAGHPSVREAVVVARPGAAGPAVTDWRLVAYVTGKGEEPVSPEALRTHLAASLPEHMIPSALVVLDALPLNPNGKVDRNALPDPGVAPDRAGGESVAPRGPVERLLAGLWSEVLGGLPLERIGVHDSFFELGGNSITGAVLINRLQERLGEIVHVVTLFDAPTIARLAAALERDYPRAVARLRGEGAEDGPSGAALLPGERVTAEKLARMRGLVRTFEPGARGEEALRNPCAVFLLSPPRSGSTLLRVMLAGNPRLFAPPELELLPFRTLAERRDAFPGRDAFRLEGALRAVMELRACGPDEARALVQGFEDEGWTTARFYRWMQEELDGRILVDKTPTYAWDLATLRRAETLFAEPTYLHLVRHPFGAIHSFEEARLDQIFFGAGHPFSRRELAELSWLLSHRNILEFLREVPAARRHRVRFEDLLRDPAGELGRICEFLGIEYHPDMAAPYEEKAARMTDGLHAESRMLGDVKFHQHRGIDADVAERWRERAAEDSLGDLTLETAAELGIEPDPAPLSFAQERLWFLDQLDPGTNTYNVTSGVRLSGTLDAAAFEASVDAVARRHAVLRTTFGTAGGQPVQVVHPRPAVPVLFADLRALPAGEREAAARRLIAESAGRPFDLARGPLLRVLVLRLDEGEHAAHFTAHHIVCDGWSLRILVRDLAAFYAAFHARRPWPLPELPLQYADYARWQRRRLQGERLEAEVAWWRERLAGVHVLQLPLDRPRPAVQTFRGSTVPFSFPRELAAALRGLGQREEATLFMTVLAAFKGLLHRIAGQDDLAVGAPVAGRGRSEIEPLIGFFVNTLALRGDLSGDPDARTVLARTRSNALGAFAHQDVPFERIVQEVAPERNLSVPPLFQVMLAFQSSGGGEEAALPGLTLEPLAEEFTTSKFDLSLSVFDAGPDLFGQWVYNVDLFDRATIARWAGCFQVFAEALADDAGRPLSGLPLLAAAEREQILVDWNRPAVDYPGEGFVHRLFEGQVERTPDAVALALDGEVLRYGELNARANRLARRLRGLGVGPEVAVGISAERSFEMVVGLLAILKAGGAYLPLDPALPEERLRFMVEDAGISLLLTQERLAPGLPSGPRLVFLDADPAEGSGNLDVALAPENAAYVIYTSGSTGVPKGVVVSHRALGNRLQYARAGDVLETDRFLQKTTISFDVSLLEIFAPLVVGARSVLVRPGGQQDLAYLVRTIREQGITYASFPPSMLYALFEQEGFAGCSSLRVVITGGETVPPVLPGQFYERLGGASLLNRYGPTETTISVTSWLCERGAAPRVLPIGRPVARTRVYLVDRNLQPVPVGGTGEILLGGLCVARGYLGRPELTAEAFLPDPFSGEAGSRLYRTGDLARYRADGAIEFAGRVDQQVKIRGFRVELGEIEAALARHPAVREAAVIDREDGPTRSLAAYVVFQAGEEAHEGALRSFLLEKLPAWMVPADFVALEKLPLSPTGKVDRKALPEPRRRGAEAAFEPPRTPTEELVAGIWAGLLGRERVGARDDFFDLGGHSLLATQAVSRMREIFAVDLPLRVLFERPTVAELAAEVDAAVRAGQGLAAPPLLPVPRGGDLPLSFAQQRLWFLEQLQPGTPTYNMPSAVRFRGRLDVAALHRSLREVVRRHESLRTTFAVRGGGPEQVVAPELDLRLPLVDLAGLPEDLREDAVRRLATEERLRPFDLTEGPLLRATLLRSGEDDHAALLTLHHIVADGWSVGVLIREIAALYPAFLAGEPSPLPELSVQYADFAVAQREWLRGEVLEAHLAWWRTKLAGHAVLQLPTDRPRPPVQRFRGADEPIVLDPEASRAFLDLGRRQGATVYMALLAAFQTLLHRYAGQDDVVVGATVAGRDRRELEPLIGFFVNTLPMRTGFPGRPSFREVLGRVRETVLGALSHQDLPFEKLVEELQPERDLSRSPLFQVVFQLQNAASAPLELPGLVLSPVQASSQTAKFDAVLNLSETPQGLAGVWKYNTDLFDRATLARMSRHLGVLLAGIAAAPDRAVAELPLLTEAERRQLGLEPGAAPAEDLGGSVLHGIFARQAVRAPGAVAVTFEGEALSYGELDRRANQLARHLAGLGVSPGDLVGLCLERSTAMVVAILGVLKAGAAYVPLDPAYPRERLAFMLQDSGIRVLLAQESLADVVPEPGDARVVFLDREAGRIAREDGSDPAAPVTADHPAYVIYTSGSTGRPKGVVVRHGNAVRLFTATEPWFGFGPEDVWTLFHSYAFDFSVWEIWGALLYGGRLVVVPWWVSRSPEAFYELLRGERVTVLNQTPSAFRQLIRAEEQVLAGGAPDLALRFVIFGGEALEPASLAPWFERHGDRRPRLVNMYGITETTVHVTYRPIGTREAAGSGSVVGQAIPDLGLYVLDAGFQPQPVGVPGEIHVAGAGLAQGYLGRPELTAERFVPNPWGAPGSRLYRSGDLARWLPDGDLEYLGRIDHQVKIRGFRIELGEIESALAAHPAVREAVVLAREDGAGPDERRLVAYVVPRGAAPTLAALRAALAGGLPEYMLPSVLVVLDRLPLTPNGKVDRRALPVPEAARPELEGAFAAPATDLERFLAGLWQEVLRVPRVGLHDDFFALGGSSITGAVLVRRLQEELREIVHVVVIFDAPTLAELSAYLIEQHPRAVARRFGREALGDRARELDLPDDKVGEAALDRFRSLVRPLAPLGKAVRRNPAALFVLSPPRSGSTLLRVMLGGHPKLFSPPELELLSFNTLAERRAAFSGRDSFWLEGAVRAVMEIRGCGAADAQALIEGMEREGLTTLEFYGRLQEWLGDRILVDKTPSYALDPEILRRAEEGFHEPRYIHLVRHPLGMIHSFEEARLDQIFFRQEHPFSRRQLAELIWTASHRNIMDFLRQVPAGRQHWIHFEDLLRDPEATLRETCERLGLDYHPDMAQPYKERSARMTDGIHAESRMLGDVKFHEHRAVDRDVAERWRERYSPDSLGGPARRLAADLGYAMDDGRGSGALPPPCLVQLRPGDTRPPLFLVHPVSGELLLYRHLVGALGTDRAVYGFQAQGFREGEEPLETIEEMADLYVEALLAVHPEGPCLLAGSSMGGLIAFEMARRLLALGREVALTALLDAPSPGRIAREVRDGQGEAEQDILRHATGGRVSLTPGDLLRLTPDQRLELVLEKSREAGGFGAGFGLTELRRLVRIVEANRRALRAYRPEPAGLRVSYIRASEGVRADAGWEPLALGGVEARELPGSHLSMHAPPYAAGLARCLRSLIERALEEGDDDAPSAALAEAGGEAAVGELGLES